MTGPTIDPAAIPILIVTFRNTTDVLRCLAALSRLAATPAYTIHLCENGGAEAFDALIAALGGPDGPCPAAADTASDLCGQERTDTLVRVRRLTLPRADGLGAIPVLVGQAAENLGYAGGVNAWLAPLLRDHPSWPGAWVLNPDTEPAPGALRALVDHAAEGRSMVGSRLIAHDSPDLVQTRGLAWRRWRAATEAVDRLSPAVQNSPPETIQARLDSPSGASLYVTRDCLHQIGLMDDTYFLYFEDLDWGMRAKRYKPVGYAHDSVVLHEGGTTIGSARSRRDHSALAAYLDFRNRLLFVRRHFPGWLAWTVLIELLEIGEYGRVGAFRAGAAAARGMAAGLRGETGRPEHVLREHVGQRSRDQAAGFWARALKPGEGKRRIKLAISLAVFAVDAVLSLARRATNYAGAPTLTILYYHAVPARHAEAFARQMRALARWARVVPADWDGTDQADMAQAGSGRPTVAITFDDAFESVLEHGLPVLARHGFPCIIFVPTGHLGQPPGWMMESDTDRAERVADGAVLASLDPALVTLGSHTVTHPHLTTMAPEVARDELLQSRQTLAALRGQAVRLFAFPYGDHDTATVALCRACGFAHVFTIEPTSTVPTAGHFVRGRVAVGPDDGPLEFFLKARGHYRWMAVVTAAKRRLWRGGRVMADAPVHVAN